MIKHIVQWTFADEAGGRAKADNGAEASVRLRSCAGLVEGMGAFEVAPAQEGLEASHDLCLYSEFDSVDALRAYATHPHHVEVGAFLRSVVTQRVAFDYDTALV